MKRVYLFSILSLCIIYQKSFASNPIKALEKTQQWLSFLDADNLDKCYETAAPFLKSSINKEKFHQAILNAQKVIGGKVNSRKFLSMAHKESLPNAPAGNYMVIQYNSVLSNGNKALEVITPMIDKETNQWKVAGYYIYKR